MPPATRARTTKKAAAPTGVAASRPPEQDAADSGAIVIPVGGGSRTASTQQGEQIHVFTYGKAEFSMPSEVSMQKVLRVLWAMNKHDPMTGGLEAVEAMLGKQALEVLLTAPEVSDKQLGAVIDKVTSHVLNLSERQEVGKDSAAE